MNAGTKAARTRRTARFLALPPAVVSLALISGACGLVLAQPADTGGTAPPITNPGGTAMLGDPIETD